MREPPPTGPIDSEDEEDRLAPRFALHRCLDQGDHRISQRFLRAVGTVVNPAWEMAVGGGLSRLEVPGHRPLMLRITNAYLERLCASPSTTIIAARPVSRCPSLSTPARLDRYRLEKMRGGLESRGEGSL